MESKSEGLFLWNHIMQINLCTLTYDSH